MNYQERYEHYKSLVDEGLRTLVADRKPRSLYEPVHYVLSNGGKRVRAVLVMAAADAVGGFGAQALKAGMAAELLHNFTLVHDDIMDSSDLRRGRATVHAKWDEGTAILAGDVIVGLSQNLLIEDAGERTSQVLKAMARGLIDVCEGQALDMEYERRNDVTGDDYLTMIAMKTGRLLEMAAEIGGLVGGGTPEHIECLQAFGRAVGLAFQIQDDLLDIVADQATFGKTIGQDVVEGKKTYLSVRALEWVREGADRELLDRFIREQGLPADLVPEMRALYQRHGLLEAARNDVAQYIDQARRSLGALPDTDGRAMLNWFADMLMHRDK